jgi:hypothetical protein
VIEKAIAFSLWGDKPRYTEGMIRNAIIAPHVFEGWQLVCFHDNTVSRQVLLQLYNYRVKLVDASAYERQGLKTGYFWRFLVNDMAERWIVRDSDSRLNVRDLTAVEEWERSGKAWHVIRDDVAHVAFPDGTPKAVTTGGWGGFRTGINMAEEVKACPLPGAYADDERWITQDFFPRVMSHSVLEHDYRTHPIPRERVGHYYVIQVWDEFERGW